MGRGFRWDGVGGEDGERMGNRGWREELVFPPFQKNLHA